MTDQVIEPLCTLEDLIRPIELPPGINLPVLKGPHDRLLHSIAVVENHLSFLRKGLEIVPRHRVYIDGLRGGFARALDEAGTAYAAFLETLDCEGEA